MPGNKKTVASVTQSCGHRYKKWHRERSLGCAQVKLCLRHSEVLRLCRKVKLSAPKHLRSKLRYEVTSLRQRLHAPTGALSSKKVPFVERQKGLFHGPSD